MFITDTHRGKGTASKLKCGCKTVGHFLRLLGIK